MTTKQIRPNGADSRLSKNSLTTGGTNNNQQIPDEEEDDEEEEEDKLFSVTSAYRYIRTNYRLKQTRGHGAGGGGECGGLG